MQTLNLHAVESITISPMQEYKTSKWVTVTITHEGGEFQINLFAHETSIQVISDPITFTLSGALADE